MADFAIPKVNTAYIDYITVVSQANTKLFQVNPTIAAGDFQTVLDGVLTGNLATLPTVTPAAGRAIKLSYSAGEFNGDNVQLQGVDAAGAEWCDISITYKTAVRGVADLAFPATSGRSILVNTDGSIAPDWANVKSPTTTVALSGTTLGLTSAERTTLIAALLNTVSTGATFNVNNSVGKQIRVAAGNVPLTLRTGTAQAGSTSNTIKLDSGASSVNGIYVNCVVQITSGTGAGQTGTVIGYVGSTKVATIGSTWATTPDNTSIFALTGSSSSLVSLEGTAQAGAAGTITLPAAAVAVDSYYNNSLVTVLSGTGSGQTRVITAYVGSTQVATVDSVWSVNPNNTSVVAVIPFPGNVTDQIQVPTPAQIAAAILSDSTAFPGADIALIQAKTTNLPADPASQAAILAKLPAALSGAGNMKSSTREWLDVAVSALKSYPVVKNVACAAFPFKMVLASDHFSPATGKTVTAQVMLDGGSFVGCVNAVVEDTVGFYHIDLAAADVNGTTGILRLTATGCDPTEIPLYLAG